MTGSGRILPKHLPRKLGGGSYKWSSWPRGHERNPGLPNTEHSLDQAQWNLVWR